MQTKNKKGSNGEGGGGGGGAKGRRIGEPERRTLVLPALIDCFILTLKCVHRV